jgi:putative inorganic carbon (hco3(-)) transporter
VIALAPYEHPLRGRTRELLRAAFLTAGIVAVEFVFFPYLLPRPEDFALPKEMTAAIVAFPLCCIWYVDIGKKGVDTVETIAIVALAMSALGLFWVPNQELGLRALCLRILAVVVFANARRACLTGGVIRFAVIVSTLMLALCVLAEAVGLIDPISQSGRGPGGTLGNRNPAAHLFALLIAFHAGELLTATLTPRRAVISAACVFLFTLTVVISRSRTAWLAVAGATLVFCCLAFRHRISLRHGMLLPISIFSGVGCYAGVSRYTVWESNSPALETLGRLTETKSGSGKGRLIQYQTTMLLVRGAPLLGVGIGNWPVAYAAIAQPDDPTHLAAAMIPVASRPSSDWLAIASECGLPTLTLLTIWCVLLVAPKPLTTGGSESKLAHLEYWKLPFLVSIGIIGSLDAFVITAAGATVTAAVVGLSSPFPAPLARAHVRTAQSMITFIALLLCGGIFVNVQRVAAYMATRDDLSVEAAIIGVAYAPMNLEARVTLIGRLGFWSRCREAAEQSKIASRLFPSVKKSALTPPNCSE